MAAPSDVRLRMNTPILITVLRMALIPVFVVVYVWHGAWTNLAAAAVFGLAALTDWLDGYLARRLKQTTRFGAFLDPVADKLVVVSAIVMMVGDRASLWLTLPGLVIVGREIVVSALREWMAEMNRRGIVAVSRLGKLKTGVQIAAILTLLAFPPGSDPASRDARLRVDLPRRDHDVDFDGDVSARGMADASRRSRWRLTNAVPSADSIE